MSRTQSVHEGCHLTLAGESRRGKRLSAAPQQPQQSAIRQTSRIAWKKSGSAIITYLCVEKAIAIPTIPTKPFQVP